jgi:hypothetical protein
MRENKMKPGKFLIASFLAFGGPWGSGLAVSASYEFCARAPDPRVCRAKAEANDERLRKGAGRNKAEKYAAPSDTGKRALF